MAHRSNVEQYRSKVTELISVADITTVSAKRIRKQIEALTNTSLEPVKREFDELVMEIYQNITDDIERSALNGNTTHIKSQQQNHHNQNSQANNINSFGLSLPPTSCTAPPPPPPAPKAKPSKTKHQDEDDDDGNASDNSFSSVDSDRVRKKSRSSSSGSSKKSSSTKSKAKAPSSSKKDKNKDKNKDKEKKEKTKRKQPVNEDGTPKVNNFTRPMLISDKLYDVIGQAGTVGPSGRVEMSRPEVVKQLWVYIKANGLQDEA
ncbi:hypothetical protein BGZ94_003015, partial [Podila epigama]